MKASPNLRRIQAALPKGCMILRQACEAAGYDARTVLVAPTDEQTDRIIAAILELTLDGEVSRQRERNRAYAAADTDGDGADYVAGRGDFAPGGPNSDDMEG